MAQILAAIGAAGVVAAFAIAVGGGFVDWGPPGTPKYETYALVNRLNGVALAFVVAAPLALRQAFAGQSQAEGVRRSLLVIAVALVGMELGSVAEFWVFNDQPYQGTGSEGRNVAWMVFLVSGLALVAGAVVTGILLLRRAVVRLWARVAVASAVPIGIATAVAGASATIIVPLVGLALCLATLGVGRPQPVRSRTPQ